MRDNAAMPLAGGADGCRAGWIAIFRSLSSDELESHVFRTASDLFEGCARADVLAIDVPIGLTDKGERACDEAARTKLGRRRSSVFSAPRRFLLNAQSQAAATALSRASGGGGISIQAFCIFGKITEVDRALRDPQTRRPPAIREVHPELSFWAMNRKRPLDYSKKKRDGRGERLELVTHHFGEDAFTSVRARYLKKIAADDDILDAFAALWTAERIIRGEARTLPDDPPLDSEGLRMEMVY